MNRIMLIDDEVPLTRIMQMAIESAGKYLVTVVNDPNEARGVAVKVNTDLIFLDVIMPALNGIQVAEQLMRDKRTRDIPIVFLSATVAKVGNTPLVDVGDGTFMELDNELLRDLPMLERPISDETMFSAIAAHMRG